MQPYKRSWVTKHSKGLLWPLLTMGFGTCVVFLYRGIRMSNPRWIASGVGFLLLTIATVSIMPAETTTEGAAPSFAEDFAVTLAVAQWVGGSVVACAFNRTWLKFVAAQEAQEYAQFPAPGTYHQHPQGLGQAPGYPQHFQHPQHQSQVPSFTPEVEQTPVNLPWQHRTPVPPLPTNPIHQLDANRARHEDFLRLGLPREVAIQLYSARIRVGHFTDFEHMLLVSAADPRVLNPLRERFSF